MQKLLLLLFAYLPFLMQAQSSAVKINSNVINQMHFDEINLRQIKPTADRKTNVYFDIEKRLGIIGKTSKDVPFYRNVKGIAIITLDQQHNKTLEQFVFIYPEKLEGKSFDVFLGRAEDMNIIATSNDFITADKLTEVMPDLVEDMSGYAKEYYANKLIKATLWAKTTGFQSVKRSLGGMDKGEVVYFEETKDYPVSIFKKSDEKNFFVPFKQKDNATDQARGYVFAPHMPVRDNKAGLGVNEKTMFTFGPDGKIVNQFEMNTKLNTEVSIDQAITENIDGKECVKGGVVFLESVKKKKKKVTKKRPNPATVNMKDFYKYDENGKLVKDLHFEVKRDQFIYFKDYWESNGQDRFFAVGYKPTEFFYYNVDENGFNKVKTWGLDAKIFQDNKYEEDLFKNYEFKLGERVQLEDGKEVVMIDVRGRIQDPRKSEMEFIYVNKGTYVLVLNTDGSILSEHILNRDIVKETAINTEMYFMNETANGVEWMMVDESGSISKKELYTVEKVTLSFDKTALERAVVMEKKDKVDWLNTDSDFWIMGKTVRRLDEEIIKDAELVTWD